MNRNRTKMQGIGKLRKYFICFLAFILMMPVMSVYGNAVYQSREAIFYELDGDVNIKKGGGKETSAYYGMQLRSGDTIITEDDSYATIQIDTEKILKIGENSIVTISNLSGNSEISRTIISLTTGMVFCEVNEQLHEAASFMVKTSNATIDAKTLTDDGSVFAVTAEPNTSGLDTKVSVFNGRVHMSVVDADAVAMNYNSQLYFDTEVVDVSEMGIVETDTSDGDKTLDTEKIEIDELPSFIIDSVIQSNYKKWLPIDVDDYEDELDDAIDREEDEEDDRPDPPDSADLDEDDIDYTDPDEDLERLDTPDDLTYSYSDNTVTAEWDSVRYAEEYEAELYDEDGNHWETKFTDETEVEFNRSVDEDEGFTIKVRALPEDEDEYRESYYATKSYRVDNDTNDPSDLELEYSADNKAISATWEYVDNADEYRVELYEGHLENLIETETTRWNYVIFDTIIENKGTYSVRLKALGEGDYEDSDYVTEIIELSETVILDAPENLKLERNDTGLVATWSSVPNAVKYSVLFFKPGELEASSTQSVTDTTASYIVELEDEGNYRVEVQTVGSNSEMSAEAAAVLSVKKLVLPTQFILDINMTTTEMAIKFKNVPGADGYEVWIHKSPNQLLNHTENIKGDVGEETTVIIGEITLENTETYEITVKANGSGQYIDSDEEAVSKQYIDVSGD